MHNNYREYFLWEVFAKHLREGIAMEEKSSKKYGWIIGGVIAFLTLCATAAFFVYHSVQEQKRNERWRHYDDKYLDE